MSHDLFVQMAYHASTNLKKILSWKTRKVYFIYPFPRRLKLEKSLETCWVNFLFAWVHILSEKNPYFGKHLYCKTKTAFAYNTSRLVRISFLINTLNKRVLLFSSRKFFCKSNRKLFSCVCISWYKNSRSWENSWRLCKPSTSSRIWTELSRILPTHLVFISGYANPENVFHCLNIFLPHSYVLICLETERKFTKVA